jgi:hypothetical protein
MRLIDADALKAGLLESKEKLWEIYNVGLSRIGLSLHTDKQVYGGQIATFQEALLRINDAPTVDAVPVVRCKDCKHWDCYGGEDSHKGDCLELEGLDCCMYEDDFCSYGERKKEDD